MAVTLVVIFHVWPERLTGGYVGVDVFFVISGYLITSHLLTQPPRTGRDLGAFWARRIHRLLPAALTVLVVTAVATRLLAPSTQWAGTAKEIIASALYVENWRLAASSVDYHAADAHPSPVQHYWSLSVEEQFYLLWPLIILAVAAAASRSGRGTTAVARVVVGVVVLVSLAVSVAATVSSPASAYFITPTRVWELGIGGLVATTASLSSSARLRTLAAPVAWAGLAAVVAAGVTLTGETPFPGYVALLPVLGTAAVIWAGAQSAVSPTGLLRSRPVQWLGDVSYSVYLWHWPIVVLLPFVSGGELGALDRSAVIVGTLVLAALTKTHVEDRFRHPRRGAPLRHSYRAAVAGMAVVTLVAGLQVLESGHRSAVAQEQLTAALEGGDPCLGAGALALGETRCPTVNGRELVPAVDVAADDKSDADIDRCFTDLPFAGRRTCTYGDGPTQVALVGNSHAGHWLPALQILAERHGWTITTYLVYQCTLSDARQRFPTTEATQGCHDYGQWVLEQTGGDRYDLVITSERQSVPVVGETLASTGPAAVAGYTRYLRQWAASGAKVLVIKDPTSAPMMIPDCLAEHPDDHDRCSGPRDEWVVDDPLAEAVDAVDLPTVTSVSFDDLVCGPQTCDGAIGGVVAYYDRSHLTATYVTTMTPYMEGPIEDALGD